MRQALVIGNWKMNGSLAANTALLDGLKSVLADSPVATAVCPPALYLIPVRESLRDSAIALGSQNLCAEARDCGAYTGEISADMLAEVECRFALVGHSERREYYFESDAIVAGKFQQAQAAGLTPVLCCGENLQQREQGETLAFIESQIMAVIDATGIQAFAKAVIAYEPIWAIGTGKTASPEQAQEVHAHIRQVIAKQDAVVAEGIQILYGGSVKADNAEALFSMPDIDGALVGGASLKVEEFSAICAAAE